VPVPALSPWRVVLGFGFVSLAVDMVSDGGRSLGGPLLGQLGATALLVGLVTGAGEAIAQGFRLVSGPWADRTRAYWRFTLAGYALTAASIPLLALSPLAGAAGLWLASCLLLADRTGKAVRSPAKTVLLADAAAAVGRGRGFAVHKSLDQVGAFLGPLLAAAVVAATSSLWPALAVLAVPGAAAIVLLLWLRRRVPDPGVVDAPAVAAGAPAPAGTPEGGTAAARRLPAPFYLFAAAALATSAGLVTFGLISFHLTEAGLVPLAAVPLVYAAAMGAAAVAALASGSVYDRHGGAVLLALPFLVALVPGLSLADRLPLVLAGVVAWGAAVGILDSTAKALVADLVPAGRRGTAYGVFAAFEGAGALAGGLLAGALYGDVAALAGIVAALQLAGLALLLAGLRSRRR